MKQRTVMILLLGTVLIWAGSALSESLVSTATADQALALSSADEADKEDAPEIKGSDSKGKYYFKKQCKSCHGKDGDGGEVTPMSKTIKQWERYFGKDIHYTLKNDAGEVTKKEMLLEVVEEEPLIHIKTFLINHAADSDQPETCG